MLQFDFTNAMAERVGAHGLTENEWTAALGAALPAYDAVERDAAAGRLGFRKLPAQDTRALAEYARHTASLFENLIVLGIGGSALGTTALASALLHPWWNFAAVEARRAPRLFVLDNVDPEEIAGHLEVVLPERTLYNVISKSGETAETTAQLLVFVDALKKRLGDRWREHVVVTTDPAKGFLRSLATREKLASFPVPPDVGGRFSALSPVSLLPLAACGVEPGRLLAGAAVAEEKGREAAFKAAALYSAPTARAEDLRHDAVLARPRVADWFRQLWRSRCSAALAGRPRGVEGQTPVKALGRRTSTRRHALQQGPNDKMIAFLEVGRFRRPCASRRAGGRHQRLAGRHGRPKVAEKRGWAGADRERAPQHHVPPRGVTPETVGGMLHFFELMTAYAGRIWNVNAFDQPVEAAKHATFAPMGRKG